MNKKLTNYAIIFVMNKQVFANISLFLTALIWGLSFVAQRAGMDYVGPFTFNTIRSFIGGLSLIPVIYIAKFINQDKRTVRMKQIQHIRLAQAGILCGIALFTAMTIQQYCMLYVPAGKAGFITALYIIYVPIISTLFLNQKLTNNVKIGVLLAVCGLYFLCFKQDTGGFSYYDILLLISAFFYGVHILVVNHFSKKVNAIKTSCVQFFVVGILSVPLMFLCETPTTQAIMDCRIPILYAGILTCGIAYTLQIFGQKYTAPVIASIILCMESVFAVIGGSIILHETMTHKEILGCVLMISAVLISELKSINPRTVFLNTTNKP